MLMGLALPQMRVCDEREMAMSREQALSKIDEYYHTGGFEADLARRIAYKTESKDRKSVV